VVSKGIKGHDTRGIFSNEKFIVGKEKISTRRVKGIKKEDQKTPSLKM